MGVGGKNLYATQKGTWQDITHTSCKRASFTDSGREPEPCPPVLCVPTSRSSVETSSTHARTWEAPGRSWGSAWSPGLTTFALAICPMGCSHSWFRVQNSQRLRCMGEALAGMPVHSGPSHLSRPICQGPRTQAHCCQAGPNTTSWATRSESQGGILTPS